MPQDSDQLDLDSLYVRALRGHEKLEGKPYYEPAADSIFLFFKDSAANAHRINGLVTLYRSIESGELVGIQIKRIKRFLDELSRRGAIPPEVTLKYILQRIIEANEKPLDSAQEMLGMPGVEQKLPEEAFA